MMKLNKSFARRVGKALSQHKLHLINNFLPQVSWGINQDCQFLSKYDKFFLEIGIGMGEHFAHHVTHNPSNFYLGAEPYLNGVAGTLEKLEPTNSQNFLLWADDIDLILLNLPQNTLDGIYILFPDPWHKKKHHKRRIISPERLKRFARTLKEDGSIYFASDIDDYIIYVQDMINDSKELELVTKDPLIPHENYIATKYHQKASSLGIKPHFLEIKLCCVS